MDKEKILTMEAGEELDSLIHEEVMGLCAHNWVTDKRFTEDYHYRCTKCKRKFDGAGHFLLPRKPRYSTGISAAWGVIEKTDFDAVWRIVNPDRIQYAVGFATGKDNDLICFKKCPGGKEVECDLYLSPVCDTLPEAICKAALLAKGVKA